MAEIWLYQVTCRPTKLIDILTDIRDDVNSLQFCNGSSLSSHIRLHIEWMTEWVSEWVSEWGSERASEWMNEWMNEWMDECVYFRHKPIETQKQNKHNTQTGTQTTFIAELFIVYFCCMNSPAEMYGSGRWKLIRRILRLLERIADLS